MKGLQSIFEGIFDTTQDSIEASIQCQDRNSKFWKYWVKNNIYDPYNKISFDYHDHILEVIDKDCTFAVSGNARPILKYFPDLRRLDVRIFNFCPEPPTELNPKIFGSTIMSSHIILDTPKIKDMIFINNPDDQENSTIVINTNTQISNTNFEQRQLHISGANYVVFKNCSGLECDQININGRNGSSSWFSIFAKIVDMNYIPDIRDDGERISKERWFRKNIWLFWTSGAYDCYEAPRLVKNFKPDMIFPGIKLPNVSLIKLYNDLITIKLIKTNGKWKLHVN